MKRDSKKFKKACSVLLVISLLSFTSLSLISIGSDTPLEKDQTNMLFNMWQLDNYKIEGDKYPPNKNEKDDYIHFKKDMTYTSKSERIVDEGIFILNKNGAYVIMSDKNGEKLKAYIVSVSQVSLILKYDINEIKDIEVHYNSTNQIQKP